MDSSLFRTRAEDPIEKEMGRGIDVVHHDKGIARGAPAIALIYAAIAGSTGTAVLMAGAPLWTIGVPAVLSAALGVFSITKAVVRTVVTPQEIIVKSGMKERRAPIDAISKIEILAGGIIAPRGVLVSYDVGGVTQQLWMASQNPEVLVSAIEHVRASPQARVRVEDEQIEEPETVEQEHAVDGRGQSSQSGGA